MRRAPAALLAAFLGLPAAGSALVILSVPPVGDILPPAVERIVRVLSAPFFDAIARLPPHSLAGRLFYASYAPLPAIFGDAALAVHSGLLALPWLVAAWVAWKRAMVRPEPLLSPAS